MNAKGMSICLLCAGALLAGCGNKSGKATEAAAKADTVRALGSDRLIYRQAEEGAGE